MRTMAVFACVLLALAACAADGRYALTLEKAGPGGAAREMTLDCTNGVLTLPGAEAAVKLDGPTLRGKVTFADARYDLNCAVGQTAVTGTYQGDVAGVRVNGAVTGTFTAPASSDGAYIIRVEAPLPAQPLRVSLQGRLIGNALAGTAKIELDGNTVESTVVGQVRPFAHTLHADRTPRTWQYTAQPDPALVEAARREATIPIRPGEPGKREFWSDWARTGGYDVFVAEDGKRIVQYDGGPNRALLVVPEEEYRAKLAASPFSGIAAPSFNLTPVAGATRYRFTVNVVPPPKPAPVLPIAPDANYKPGKDVPVETLVIGKSPQQWLVSDAIGLAGREDFMPGGLAGWRPESGTTFTVALHRAHTPTYRVTGRRIASSLPDIGSAVFMICAQTLRICDERPHVGRPDPTAGRRMADRREDTIHVPA